MPWLSHIMIYDIAVKIKIQYIELKKSSALRKTVQFYRWGSVMTTVMNLPNFADSIYRKATFATVMVALCKSLYHYKTLISAFRVYGKNLLLLQETF